MPGSDEKLEVTVIVPVRNEEASIRRVLDQLLQQDLAPREIILADGGSTDGTKGIIREYIRAGHPVLLVEDADAYPGRARNLAIGQATTDWVAMTDAGTAVPPDWLCGLVRRARERDGVGVVFGSYEPILNSFFEECLAIAFVPPATPTEGRPYRGPSTASMMIRRDVWESLGRFPEHLRACEDLQFFERLRAAKVDAVLAPEASVGWNIPSGFRAAFRRFRLYSRHTLAAGMGGSWQLALARMYLATGGLTALGVFLHWAWFVPLVLAGGARVHRSVRRRPWLPLRHRVGPHTYLMVAALTLWLDLAAFVGCADYAIRSRVRPKPRTPLPDRTP